MKVEAVTVRGLILSIGLGTLKVALMLELGHTDGAVLTGNTEATVIFAAGMGAAAVVKLHI
jgi:hypothetical protein